MQIGSGEKQVVYQSTWLVWPKKWNKVSLGEVVAQGRRAGEQVSNGGGVVTAGFVAETTVTDRVVGRNWWRQHES